jgi:hypothetical protein
MTVLRLHKAEETGAGEPTMWRAIEPGGMSTELTEDGGATNVSLRQLPAPGTIAASDLAARLADADAAISTIQELLGEVRTSHESWAGPWTTSSGIATSGAGGPSGLPKGRGGGASQAEIGLCRPPGGHASQVAWEFQANSWPSRSALRRFPAQPSPADPDGEDQDQE